MWPSRQGYVAMVDWGDGTVSRGRITRLRATGLTVMGRHTWRGATRRRTLTVTVTTPGMSGTLTARRTVVLTRQ